MSAKRPSKLQRARSRTAKGRSLKRVVRALCDKPVWILGEKYYVNNVVLRCYEAADKHKHPSACELTDAFIDDVEFHAP